MPGRSRSDGGGWRSLLPRDPYTIAACLVFVSIVVLCWSAFVETDEELYLLGSRRVADPNFLAVDWTWSRLPPTSALFDHLVAPLWSFLDAFAIVNLGRLLFWGLMAWSITLLAKTIRLPAWSVVVGFTIWLLWRQSLGTCGSPLQGFQPKSFAYPLVFFALTFAIRGEVVWAGIAAGLSAVFHVIVGGWACLALFSSMLVNRRLFTPRQLAIFLLSAAPFVVPLLVAVGMFRMADASGGDQGRMSEIYAVFAMPHCCDASYFMAPSRIPLAWLRAAVVFALAPVPVFAWPHRRGAMILGAFTVMLIGFFIVGLIAERLELHGVLTLYPYQLGNAIPALFLFMFVGGWIAVQGFSTRHRWAIAVPVLAGAIWLMLDAHVEQGLVERPQVFFEQVRVMRLVSPTMTELDQLFEWIRTNTPRNSVFITPLIHEFWPYAERAQVASMRHPPLDRRIIEWKERLEALNGFRPYERQGFETEAELAAHERNLSIRDLIRIRDQYGATHYLVQGERRDLAAHLVYSQLGYFLYDVTGMSLAECGAD